MLQRSPTALAASYPEVAAAAAAAGTPPTTVAHQRSLRYSMLSGPGSGSGAGAGAAALPRGSPLSHTSGDREDVQGSPSARSVDRRLAPRHDFVWRIGFTVCVLSMGVEFCSW